MRHLLVIVLISVLLCGCGSVPNRSIAAAQVAAEVARMQQRWDTATPVTLTSAEHLELSALIFAHISPRYCQLVEIRKAGDGTYLADMAYSQGLLSGARYRFVLLKSDDAWSYLQHFTIDTGW